MHTFHLTISLFIALLFVGCTASDAVQPVESPTGRVTLSFSPYDLEPLSRATSPISAYCSRLDVWIDDGNVTSVYHQTTDTPGFGTLSLTLNRTKTYSIVAVAHKCAEPATFADGIISFPSDRLTHAMTFTTSFSPSDSSILSCVMTRIVGAFRLETTDAVPKSCATMRFTFACNDRWHIATATSTHQADKSVDIPVTSTHDDGTAAFTFYLMPANLTDTSQFHITATALTTSGAVIESKTFSDVPLRAGYRTTYRGMFFTTVAPSAAFLIDDITDLITINY